MTKVRLGVNIDHVATIRNARGEIYPEPYKAAKIAQSCGADSVTIHLREDRRHIKLSDLKKIKKKIHIPLNLEMAPTQEMLKIALKYKPNFVCIVPEKRHEMTTENGLNVKKNKRILKKMVQKLKEKNIRTCLFIEPKIFDVRESLDVGVDCVEFHTGRFCAQNNKFRNAKSSLNEIINASNYAKNNGLEVHAGHGLTYKSAKIISKIKSISELNIGHFIISESIFLGLKNVVRKFRKIVN